jgi:uncharacterized protein (TIGR00730 family)
MVILIHFHIYKNMQKQHTNNNAHSLTDIKNSCKAVYGSDGEMIEICKISKELEQGIDIVSRYPRVATIYGSARLDQNHTACISAEEIAYRLTKDHGYAIMTGGAGGIMAAGNHGANRAGGSSIGSTIKLNTEQSTNPDVTEAIPFEYFFTRKTVLRYGSECAIFFTGGFGTFDELFELLTLLQTKKIKKIPVILFGKDFWSPLNSYIKETVLEKFETIGTADMDLYTITDNIDEVINIAKHAMTKADLGINE